MRKIKVLYVVTTLGIGGVQEHLRLLVKYLDENRFDIWLAYGPPGDKAPAFRGMGVTLYRSGLIKKINPYKDFKAFLSLWSLMRRERFDIVHVHMAKAGILGRLAAKFAGIKVISMTGHGWSGHLDNYFRNPILKKWFHAVEWFWGKYLTDAIILLTKEDFDEMKRRKMYSPDKLFLVPNGIDVQELQDAPSTTSIRDELAIRPQDMIIVMVGRICKVKAPWIFAKAADIISRIRTDIRFLLIGEGPESSKISEMVSELQKKGIFHMPGVRKDVPSILKETDIFVLTSITEGMAITLLEAMALGLPVVVTDIPGNRALVKHGKTGILVQPNDSEAFSTALLNLLNEESLRNKLGQNAKKYIEENFPARRTGEKTQAIYLGLLEKKRAQRNHNQPSKS
jgi:glycosyltransferase involved in cell wall biosynthesis